MPIELNSLSGQLLDFGRAAVEAAPFIEDSLTVALRILHQNAHRFKEMDSDWLDQQQAPFRAAEPLYQLDISIEPLAVPRDYVVIATDGSQLEPDRHGPVLCHLTNVGWAVIRYGQNPDCQMGSLPRLAFREDEVYLTDGKIRVLVQDKLLGMKRTVEEMERLAELARSTDPSEIPVVGMADGTLLLSSWGQEEGIWKPLVKRFITALGHLRDQSVVICSYISRPRSSDVVNLLRILCCPENDKSCNEACGDKPIQERPCNDLAVLSDGIVFGGLPLGPGERSGVFKSSWSTSERYYPGHEIHFFYVNIGSEVARIEVPVWVAEDVEKLDLVHSVVLDQCNKGQGYPRVLIESHEQAVVTASDRRLFEYLLREALISVGLKPSSSEKELSKRLRTV